MTVRMVIGQNLASMLVMPLALQSGVPCCRWLHSGQPWVVQPDVDVSRGVRRARARSNTPQMPLMASEASSTLSVGFQIRIDRRELHVR